MSELVVSFMHEMAALSPGLTAAFEETIDYWAPDTPPAIITLIDLGHRVVDDINSVDPSINAAIFNAIESALEKGDVDLGTAVATGMIEAIVGHALGAGIWDEVLPRFGKLSASHAIAWASP